MSIQRAGLYTRVSTEEQALHGFSIETQISNLRDYCEKSGIKVAGIYTDDGVSGGKPAFKRPAMAHLLQSVQDGEIDIILFTKLDRWFRNVKEYFKVQEILDRYQVAWKAIHEDYDTTTANGRMAITIFLAIAQNEREKTSERIQVVFQHKRRNKEACFGGPNKPLGYKKQKDADGVARLVKDPEDRQICEEFWEIMVKYNNINKAIRYIGETYGIMKSQKTWSRIVRSPFYCGMYGGVEDYCEPYVTKEEWDRIQATTRARPRKTQHGRVYLFTGMLRCPICGHVLCGTYKTSHTKKGVKEYFSYRCRFRSTPECGYQRAISERKLERYLLENIAQLSRDEIASAELENTNPKPTSRRNVSALKERLRRLNVMYMAGNKSDDDYLRESAEIKSSIASAEEEVPKSRNLEPLKSVLATDFPSLYASLSQEDKRRLWRSIIKEIRLNDNRVDSIVFL